MFGLDTTKITSTKRDGDLAGTLAYIKSWKFIDDSYAFYERYPYNSILNTGKLVKKITKMYFVSSYYDSE